MNLRPYPHTCRNGRAGVVHRSRRRLVIGDVVLGDDVSIWPGTVVRGDVNFIRIGARTNIQDGTVVHVSHDGPHAKLGGFATVIGEDVTIGHKAIIHACRIEDAVLIGMGAIVLDGAVVKKHGFVGAGALVAAGQGRREKASCGWAIRRRRCGCSATPRSKRCTTRPALRAAEGPVPGDGLDSVAGIRAKRRRSRVGAQPCSATARTRLSDCGAGLSTLRSRREIHGRRRSCAVGRAIADYIANDGRQASSASGRTRCASRRHPPGAGERVFEAKQARQHRLAAWRRQFDHARFRAPGRVASTGENHDRCEGHVVVTVERDDHRSGARVTPAEA